MESVSAGEVGGIFAGAVTLIVSFGAGIRWLIGWKDSRQDLREKKLSAWEAQLQQRDKEYHRRVEERLEATEKKLGAVSAALFATIAEVQILDPVSPALVRARTILHAAYPVPEHMPDDIASLVHRLGLSGE
jgi:hypothetical protein